MDILRSILNANWFNRLVIGIIIFCAIGSPTVNGFTQNRIWLYAAIVWGVFVLWFTFSKVIVTKKHDWILLTLIALFVALLYVLIVKFA